MSAVRLAAINSPSGGSPYCIAFASGLAGGQGALTAHPLQMTRCRWAWQDLAHKPGCCNVFQRTQSLIQGQGAACADRRAAGCVPAGHRGTTGAMCYCNLSAAAGQHQAPPGALAGGASAAAAPAASKRQITALSACDGWTVGTAYTGLISILSLVQALLPQLHLMLFQHDSTDAAGGTSNPAAAAAAVETAAASAGGRLPDGTRLFSAVWAAAAGCGSPPLASALQRLAWHADQTLFRQLSSWCGCSSDCALACNLAPADCRLTCTCTSASC